MSASAASTSTAPRAQAAERLWHAAGVVLAVMPVAMAIAHRSAPLFLGISTALALAAVLLERRLPDLAREIGQRIATPVGAAALAFCAWATVSILWSEFKLTSWRAYGEFWSTVAAALVLATLMPSRVPRSVFWVLVGSIALACASMAFELSTGMALRQSLGTEAWSFIFNRPILTVMVLAVPALAWLAAKGGRREGLLALGLFLLVVVTNAVSDSGAASLGLLAMVPVAVLARVRPRLANALVAAGIVVAFLVAPFQGEIARRVLPQEAYTELAGGHTQERVSLWRSFGAVIAEKPWIGNGFGISPQMRHTQVANQVPRRLRRMLDIGHPHNAAMQIFVELGIIGAVLAVATLLLALWALRNLSARQQAPALALVAGAGAASLVGHGAWQGWWAAAIGAAVVWLLLLNQKRPEAP